MFSSRRRRRGQISEQQVLALALGAMVLLGMSALGSAFSSKLVDSAANMEAPRAEAHAQSSSIGKVPTKNKDGVEIW